MLLKQLFGIIGGAVGELEQAETVSDNIRDEERIIELYETGGVH